jgi:hypothetical protein
VEDPANGVVDGLRGGEGLVTALVGNNPDTGGRERARDGVRSVKDDLSRLVGNGRDVELVKEGLDVESKPDADGDRSGILDNVNRRAEGRALEAVGTVRSVSGPRYGL